MERRPSEWLKFIKMYVDDGVPMMDISRKYKVDVSKLKYKVKVYKLHGEAPFTDEQEKRIYTREEKLKAIKTVISGEKSGRQVAIELGIPNARIVHDWVDKFKKEGEEAIQVSRGRKKYMLHKDRQAFLADKEIKARCEHLEAENEYLKKSLALAFKKDKRLKKKYESLMNSRANIN